MRRLWKFHPKSHKVYMARDDFFENQGFVFNSWSSLYRVRASKMSFLDKFIKNLTPILVQIWLYARLKFVWRRICRRLRGSKARPLKRTYWGISKFEALRELSLAIRFLYLLDFP